MDDHDLLQDLQGEMPVRDRPLYTPGSMRILYITTGCFAIVTIVAMVVFIITDEKTSVQNQLLASVLLIELLVIPFIAFILSLFIGVFPIRGRSYERKIFSMVYLVACLLYGAQLVFMLFILLLSM